MEDIKLRPGESATKLKLETHRFQLSKETLSFLNQSELDLAELQKKAPYVLGLSFLGSRTVGGEKRDSDLDCIISYDGESIPGNFSPISFSNEGKISLVDIERYTNQLTEFKELLEGINNRGNTKVPYHIAGMVDLSISNIEQTIDNFSLYLKSDNQSSSEAWQIAAPFFLSIGDGVYKARREILSSLSKREDGQKLWEKVVEELSRVERDSETEKRGPLPAYKTYPKRLEDVQSFFIVNG